MDKEKIKGIKLKTMLFILKKYENKYNDCIGEEKALDAFDKAQESYERSLDD